MDQQTKVVIEITDEMMVAASERRFLQLAGEYLESAKDRARISKGVLLAALYAANLLGPERRNEVRRLSFLPL